jgi:hypothetical protein
MPAHVVPPQPAPNKEKADDPVAHDVYAISKLGGDVGAVYRKKKLYVPYMHGARRECHWT